MGFKNNVCLSPPRWNPKHNRLVHKKQKSEADWCSVIVQAQCRLTLCTWWWGVVKMVTSRSQGREALYLEPSGLWIDQEQAKDLNYFSPI